MHILVVAMSGKKDGGGLSDMVTTKVCKLDSKQCSSFANENTFRYRGVVVKASTCVQIHSTISLWHTRVCMCSRALIEIALTALPLYLNTMSQEQKHP